jgi:hypothetical protein
LEETLVSKPKSCSKLFETLTLRSEYGNHLYTDIPHDLHNESEISLQEKEATWHRSCYLALFRERDIDMERRRTKAIGAKDQSDEGSDFSRSFIRSLSSPLDSDTCSFCQSPGSKRNALHKVNSDTK